MRTDKAAPRTMGYKSLEKTWKKKTLVRSPPDLGHPGPSVATGLKGGQRRRSQSSRPMREQEHRGAHRLGWMDSGETDSKTVRYLVDGWARSDRHTHLNEESEERTGEA